MMNQKELFGFTPARSRTGRAVDRQDRIGSKPPLTPGSAVLRRLVEVSTDIEMSPGEQIAFQHTVLCQTGMPYRNPGENTRLWERRNGQVLLRIEAGSAMHPVEGRFVDMPLPFGPKARLILIHLNGEALRIGSPAIEVEDSMTAFVKRLLCRDPNGREVNSFKDQLRALSTALVRLATTDGQRALQVDTKVVTAFDLWAPISPHQRVLWPSTIRLSEEYFASLTSHAVPLDERAIAALAHSAMGLDVYAWLAQRLHRVARGRPQLVPWTALHEQFGQGYSRIRKFREVFLRTLCLVDMQYRAARVEVNQKGLVLRNSPPPVGPRVGVLSHRATPKLASE